MKMKATCLAISAAVTLTMAGVASADGNRYDYERYYKAEISVSDAYLEMEHSKGHNKKHKHRAKPVLIDVRTLREYASGHPEDSYNVPFPNIYVSGDQDPATLYWEVYDIVKGRMDTKIMLLCRTGSRSVRAGNILANPESDPATAGLGLAPFTNVHNIWEGFVGQYKYAFTGGTVTVPPQALDLNNNSDLDTNGDGLDDDTADVYTETKDWNPDKDGWRNFAALPWTTKIRRPLSYMQDPGLYADLNLTPVD